MKVDIILDQNITPTFWLPLRQSQFCLIVPYSRRRRTNGRRIFRPLCILLALTLAKATHARFFPSVSELASLSARDFTIPCEIHSGLTSAENVKAEPAGKCVSNNSKRASLWLWRRNSGVTRTTAATVYLWLCSNILLCIIAEYCIQHKKVF